MPYYGVEEEVVLEVVGEAVAYLEGGEVPPHPLLEPLHHEQLPQHRQLGFDIQSILKLRLILLNSEDYKGELISLLIIGNYRRLN